MICFTFDGGHADAIKAAGDDGGEGGEADLLNVESEPVKGDPGSDSDS